MAGYAAFLRGINVGGHTVTNDRLHELFEALGFASVTPFLASGNIAFAADGDPTTDELAERIADHLGAELGYEVASFARTADEVRAIAEHEPFPDATGGKVHVGFLHAPADTTLRDELTALAIDTDRVAFDDRELYWYVAGSFMDSALSGREVTRLLGDTVTLRTAKTVERLVNKLPD